jgi:hypothetical protein
MNYVQKKCATFAVIGLSLVLCSFFKSKSADHEEKKYNDANQELWSSKSPDEVLKMDTKRYNRRSFENQLSAFGYYEYKKLNKEQRHQAMKVADGSQISPDAAVFIISPTF